MLVTTWHLQMHERPEREVRALPDGVRFERATGMTPAYARYLYALVGGDWFWTDRLPWSQEQWLQEINAPGEEFWVLYREGAPSGFVHLHPVTEGEATEVEILHFGLAEHAIGKGLGRGMLEHGIEAAWSLPGRHGLPDARRVWLHTCSNDGPAALSNYKARGFEVFDSEEKEEDLPEVSPGTWAALGGK